MGAVRGVRAVQRGLESRQQEVGTPGEPFPGAGDAEQRLCRAVGVADVPREAGRPEGPQSRILEGGPESRPHSEG